MASKVRINRWLELFLAAICFLAPMAAVVPWSKLDQSDDFARCYAASYLMHSDAYRLIHNANFFVPPTIGWLFAPLSLLKLKMALYTWVAVSIIAMFVACLILCNALGLKSTKRLWVFAGLGVLGPCVMSIWHQQLLPLVLFALVGLYVSLRKRRLIYASVYQFLLWFKPYIFLPLIVYEFALGQSNLVVISLLLATIGVLISCLRGGTDIIWNYGQLCLSQRLDTPVLSLLQAFAVPNLTILPAWRLDLYKAVFLATCMSVLIIAFLIGKKVKTKKMSTDILFTFLVPLSLCLCSASLAYDLLLIAPGILLLIVSQAEGWRKYLKILLILTILAVLILPDYLAVFSWGIFRDGFISPFFWIAIAFALGSLIIQVRTSVAHAEVPD